MTNDINDTGTERTEIIKIHSTDLPVPVVVKIWENYM
jgi:hypothetical protein